MQIMLKKFILIAVALAIIGVSAALLAIPRSITVSINGQSQFLRTRALTVEGMLHQMGIVVSSEDQLEPPLSTWLKPGLTIRLDQAQTVTVVVSPSGKRYRLESAQRRPADLLAEAALTLAEHDQLTLNGLSIHPNDELPFKGQLLLELHQAVPVNIQDNGLRQTVYSSAATLGQALWNAGIILSAADRSSLPLDTPLSAPMNVEITRAAPVTIQFSEKVITVPSVAESVAGVLSEAGISLHGLDYSLPADEEPLPGDRVIRVVRVLEEVILSQTPIPFKNVYQPDENTELDRRSVVKPGEFGVQVAREKIRYEDGSEVSRSKEDQWVAKAPQDQVIGYGTQPVIKSIDTPYGTLEYWRAVDVYATSYSPCRLGIPNYCNSTTASGLPLRQGIVAVTRAWYSWMAGQRVYIPGYGIAVIADTGGGIPGRYWVDLGYSDDDFVSWHSTVTMYFLTPLPATIPWILP